MSVSTSKLSGGDARGPTKADEGSTRPRALPGQILLADDDPLFLKLSAELLRERGHQVITASSGEEVLRRLERERFDLLITDIFMPGNEELQLLGARGRSWPPVILVTAAPSMDTAIKAVRAAAFDYIPKPFDIDEFCDRVAVAIETGRRGRRRADTEELSARLSQLPLSTLTTREFEILSEFDALLSVREVAEKLSISPHTVRSHLKALFRKLGVASQSELRRLLLRRPDERS